jgi:hypothetical protein
MILGIHMWRRGLNVTVLEPSRAMDSRDDEKQVEAITSAEVVPVLETSRPALTSRG